MIILQFALGRVNFYLKFLQYLLNKSQSNYKLDYHCKGPSLIVGPLSTSDSAGLESALSGSDVTMTHRDALSSVSNVEQKALRRVLSQSACNFTGQIKLVLFNFRKLS